MVRFNRLAYFILLSVALRAYSLPLAQLRSEFNGELDRRGCLDIIKGPCVRLGDKISSQQPAEEGRQRPQSGRSFSVDVDTLVLGTSRPASPMVSHTLQFYEIHSMPDVEFQNPEDSHTYPPTTPMAVGGRPSSYSN